MAAKQRQATCGLQQPLDLLFLLHLAVLTSLHPSLQHYNSATPELTVAMPADAQRDREGMRDNWRHADEANGARQQHFSLLKSVPIKQLSIRQVSISSSINRHLSTRVQPRQQRTRSHVRPSLGRHSHIVMTADTGKTYPPGKILFLHCNKEHVRDNSR